MAWQPDYAAAKRAEEAREARAVEHEERHFGWYRVINRSILPGP